MAIFIFLDKSTSGEMITHHFPIPASGEINVQSLSSAGTPYKKQRNRRSRLKSRVKRQANSLFRRKVLKNLKRKSQCKRRKYQEKRKK